MSKTVKRVIIGMTVSLVAMLGAKVEAHWIVVKGQCYWHSGECVRKDKEPPPDPIPIDTVGELVSTVHQVEILCPNAKKGQTVNGEWTLTSGKKPIVPSDITTTSFTTMNGAVTGRNAEWFAVVSDASFLEGLENALCPQAAPPLDVIIHSMSAQMNLYCNPKFDPACKTELNQIHSRWSAECVLDGFKFPNKVPTRGIPFQCSDDPACHVVDEQGNPC